MDTAMRAVDTIKSFRVTFVFLFFGINADVYMGQTQETRLSALRPPNEFFDHNRISRPADLNQAVTVRPFFVRCGCALTDLKTAHIVQYPLLLWYFPPLVSFILSVWDGSLMVTLLQETMGW